MLERSEPDTTLQETSSRHALLQRSNDFRESIDVDDNGGLDARQLNAGDDAPRCASFARRNQAPLPM